MNKGFMVSRSLSWAEVAALIGTQISTIIKREVACTAFPEDEAYWVVCVKDIPFSIKVGLVIDSLIHEQHKSKGISFTVTQVGFYAGDGRLLFSKP